MQADNTFVLNYIGFGCSATARAKCEYRVAEANVLKFAVQIISLKSPVRLDRALLLSD